jgi:hypothetical protein
MAEGCFDRLPGRGRPLALEDLSHLAPEMRLAYIILKNSGFLEDGWFGRPGPAGAAPAGDLARLERLRFKLARAAGRGPDSDPLAELDPEYVEKLLDKIS